jgi:predicted nucleic-acid-binding protein
MIGLDTNIVLRWLVDESIWPDDAPAQTALAAKTLSRRDERFFINDVVLAETVWVLTNGMKQPRPVVITLIERMLKAANVTLETPAAIQAAIESLGREPGDFADHLIGHINRIHGCRTTFTFDKPASRASTFTRLGSGS